MAALFLHPQIQPSETHGERVRVGGPSRPQLVVIEGGRAGLSEGDRAGLRTAARRRHRVFLVRRLAVLATAVVVVAATVSIITSGTSSDTPAASVPASYVVQPGDTLWSIASSFHLDTDVREVVDVLARANGGNAISAGQQLDIPNSLRD